MGKGDKKTRKGKIAKGSYGTTRPRTSVKEIAARKAAKAASKKTTAKK